MDCFASLADDELRQGDRDRGRERDPEGTARR
jgi:hypothetical protein